MGMFKSILGIIVILALLLLSSAPFLTQLATAAEGEYGMEFEAVPIEEAEPEEDASGELSVKPVHMVLESPVGNTWAEPPRETAPSSTGWQTIMSDGFEGSFPGVWDAGAGGDADAYWGKDSYNPHSGSYSVFCAKSGSDGVDPPAEYPNGMSAWMVYGPFSLADAADATLDFYLWLESESSFFDLLFCGASIDGMDFYGDAWSGNSGGWVPESFDLTDVPDLGDLCGESQVWILFIFESDLSVTYQGAFIDDVVLQKYVGAVPFDLEAVEVYLSTELGDVDKEHVVDTPTVGQDVYFHFKWNCYGSGTTPEFHIDINLDGIPFCGGDITADGDTYHTGWCTSPWTATAGAHTLTGVLDVNDDVEESNETNNEASKSWGGAPPEATWTFMVYLDGDNNLEEAYIYNFNLMETAADNVDVNIIVQFDRIPGVDSSNGDWTTTRRYKVKYDTDIFDFASYTLDMDYWELGELNMADPSTLSDFVLWTKTNYPTDHYFLAIVNHGGGWQPTAGGQRVPTGILWDDTNADYMSTADLGSALSLATSGGTEKLDVLFLDACLMQMIEVGYEVKDYSQYLVASEHIGWAPGPYHAYISSITSTTTAPQLATAIVNEYHNELTGTMYAHTMSATDLSQYGLASVADDFALALIGGLSTYQTEMESSRAACQEFYVDSYIDLYHFAYLIDQNIADATIQTAAQAVMTAVNNAVIAEAHENGSSSEYYPLDDAHGISIYFPASAGDSAYIDYNSINLAFVADKNWDEFLAAFLGVNNPPVVTNVTASQSSPTVNITYDVSDVEQSEVSISFEYWDGASWQACVTTTGEDTQSTGTGKSGTWDAKTDFDEHYMTDCKIRVTADDGQAENNIGTGESNTFTLDTKDPTGYGCSTPVNGAAGVSINPDLICLTASDDSPPISYYFQLAENDTLTLGLQESGWQSSTTWSPSTLDYNKQYFWRVKTKDSYDNETDYGSTFNFTTQGPSGTLRLVEGVNIIAYTGATTDLPAALTNIGPTGLNLVTIVWARGEWTGSQWLYYNAIIQYGTLSQLEEGRAYIICVTEDCTWELP